MPRASCLVPRRWCLFAPYLYDPQYLPTLCFGAAYSTALLNDGYGMPMDDTPVDVVDQIKGTSVEWAYGRMIFEANKLAWTYDGPNAPKPTPTPTPTPTPKPHGGGGKVVDGGGGEGGGPYKILFWVAFFGIVALVSAGVVHMYTARQRRMAESLQLGQRLINESFDGDHKREDSKGESFGY